MMIMGEGGELSIPTFEAGAPSSTFVKSAEVKTAEVKPGIPISSQPGIDEKSENKTDSATVEQSAISPTPEEGEVAKMSPRKRTEAALRGGVDQIIKKAYDSGFFSQPGKEDAKKDAEAVLKAAEQGQLDSNGLKLYFKTLSAIGGENADGVGKIAAEYLRVKIGSGADEKLLTKGQWEEQLDGATLEEKAKLEETGLYGFIFPQEAESQTPKERLPEDIIIEKSLKDLEARVGWQEKNTGAVDEATMELLRVLRLAKAAEGNAGSVLKLKAIRGIEAKGVSMPDGVIENIEQKAKTASQRIVDFLKGQNWSENQIREFSDSIGKPDFEEMVMKKNFPTVEGLADLIFGRELTKDELRELIDPNKKSKLPLFLAILLTVLAQSTASMKEAVK